MSIRRLNKIAFYAAREIAFQFRARFIKFVPPNAAKFIQRFSLSKSNIALTRKAVFRTFQRTVRNPRLFYGRPFATSLHYQHQQRNRFDLYENQFGKVVHKFRDFEGVKNLFGTNARYNSALNSSEMPNSLSGYEIGKHIACGCNATIHELRVRDAHEHRSIIERLSYAEKDLPSCSTQEKAFPLAIKMMFNYEFGLPERFLWMEMGPEMIPLRKLPPAALQGGKMARFKPLPKSHPNLIELHTAFVDIMPTLPGAELLYPEALPNLNDYESLIHEPKTLFIVMKRYRMTLRAYVLTQKRNYWMGRVMYGQLLEAIVYLYEHKISHRDMKSDNVLLDFDHDEDVPHVVLSDFGSALASNDWRVSFDDEDVDLGGNLSLRAPEIRRARAGPGVVLDFSMADTWSAATLAYEIFTRSNPFYSCLSSERYLEEELMPLPKRVHHAVKNVTYNMLSINPDERPKPQIAANVVSLSLFRFGQNLRDFFEQCGLTKRTTLDVTAFKSAASSTLNALADRLEKKIDAIVELYAAETILSKLINPNVISNAELQLRATFLTRLNRDEVRAAMSYVLAADDEDVEEGFNGGVHASSASYQYPDNCGGDAHFTTATAGSTAVDGLPSLR